MTAKRLFCLIAALAVLLLAVSCNDESDSKPNELNNSIELMMSEMELSEDEAFAALEILCDLGLDTEIEYIYSEESGGETFYKVWYGLHLMKVYLKEGRIEKVIKNQQEIYPPTNGAENESSSHPNGDTPSTGSSASDAPTSGDSDITIISMTSPVKAGSKATLEIQGEPNTEYDITVKYASGASSAAGLEPKLSDADGKASWTWKVGSQVKPGKYTATITSGGKSLTVEFEVE